MLVEHRRRPGEDRVLMAFDIDLDHVDPARVAQDVVETRRRHGEPLELAGFAAQILERALSCNRDAVDDGTMNSAVPLSAETATL